MNINKGFFWHVHHEVLLGWCYNYNERAEFIRTDKLLEEQAVRLRLFQPVKGQLPRELVEARRAYDEAYRAYYGAYRAYYGARRAYVEARRVYYEVLNKNMPAIEALHKAECPNCPWNGRTIFPRVS